MSIRAFASDRRGAVLVEALLALPVLVLITFAGVQYTQVVVVEQAVQAAADAAAREAAKLPYSWDTIPSRIEQTVNAHLAGFGIQVGPGVRIDYLVAPYSSYLNRTPNSDPTLPVIRLPIQPEDTSPYHTVVNLEVRYPATGLPNMLAYFGIDFSNRIFRATATAHTQY